MIAPPDSLMKMIEETGGPAHPYEFGLEGGAKLEVCGLMIRDWFAAQALIALLSQRTTNIDNLGYVFPSEKEPICSAAYAFADAMLAKRKPTP